MFNEQPKLFVPNNQVSTYWSKSDERFESRIKLVKELAQKYELGKCMEKCIYSNRHILFNFKDEELESLCQAVEKDYGFTQVSFFHYFKEQVSSVFTSYYRTINPKLTFMLD